MSEPRSTRKLEGGSEPKAKTDSQLRLVTADGNVVFDERRPPDDPPTIISKKIAGMSEAAVGNLRGKRLAHFELIEAIGVGGMAAVLRARDSQLDRNVALKILPPDMAKDPENVLRFHQEARAAAKLDHENIARVFYYGEDQGLHFIAFEFVDGKNLRTILERRGKIPVREAIRYVLQIASGLEHAASRGVVHRDVKPSNIIVTETGRAKLVDMGLARSMEKQNELGLTQSGVTLGTFDYISPEQAIEPRDADSRSDIYSLGCTLYHMLTGIPPVPEGTAAKKLHHHQHVLPQDPRQLCADIPDEVAMVLGKMMAKDLKDRYQRPIELVQHLMKVAHKVGAADDLPEGGMFVDARLPGEPRRRPFLVVSLAFLALAAVLVALSMVPPTKTPSKPKGQSPAQVPLVSKKTDVFPQIELPAPVLDARAVFQDPKRRSIVDLAGKIIDLSDEGVEYTGKLRDAVENGQFNFSSDNLGKETLPDERRALAGIVIADGSVTFRRVKFRMDSKPIPSKFPASMIQVRGSSVVRFEDCEFIHAKHYAGQVRDNPELHLFAFVSVDEDLNGKIPKITFDGCFFDFGQAPVVLHDSAEVTASQCAFMPQQSLIQHRGKGDSKITLENCSAYVMNGPAFRFDDEVSCKLRVSRSIFSNPASKSSTEGDEPDYICQTSSKVAERIVYEGKSNLYHNLNNLWSRRNGLKNFGALDRFREEIEKAEGSDPDSTLLETSPWKHSNSYKRVKEEAFQIALGIPEAIGMQRWGLALDLKLVDLDALDSSVNDKTIFNDLDKALSQARPGDVILIKGGEKRDVAIASSLLTKGPVTLRAYPGEKEKPNLVMQTHRRKTWLFNFGNDAKFTFENLEITLAQETKGMPEGMAHSVLRLEGNAQCAFVGCDITLNGKDNFNLVEFGAGDPRALADVSFKNCLIRGDGDILALRAPQACTVRFENTKVALNGSVVHFQGSSRDGLREGDVKVMADKSTFFLRKPFLTMHVQGNLAGLAPWTVDAKNTLFALMDDVPLLLAEGDGATKETAPASVKWIGEKNRYYAPMDRWLSSRLEAGGTYDLTHPRSDGAFTEMTFENAPATLYDWTREDFDLRLKEIGLE